MSDQMSEFVARSIPLDQIYLDQTLNEGRGEIKPIDVATLMNSIEEHGLQEPVIIAKVLDTSLTDGRPFKLVAGYMRMMAHVYLKMETINSVIREPMTDEEMRIINIIENEDRTDLNLLQQAYTLRFWIRQGLGPREISEITKLSYGYCQVRCYLLELPEDLQQLAKDKILTQQHIRDLRTTLKKHGELACYNVAKEIKRRRTKGQREVTVAQLNRDHTLKRLRKKTEIFEMMDHYALMFGTDVVTRVFAWCAGEIDATQLFDTFEEFAKLIEKPYNRPDK